MSRRAMPLDLPRPTGAEPAAGTPLRPRRRRGLKGSRRFSQACLGLLLGGLGVGILAGLVRIPDRLDALLLVSHAIANLIGGLSRLALGLLQLGAVLLVVFMALLALLLLAGGLVRLWRAVLPRSPHPAPEVGAPPPRSRPRRLDGQADPSPPPLL